MRWLAEDDGAVMILHDGSAGEVEDRDEAPADARLHLIKLSVGSDSIETLRGWQAERRRRFGRLFHRTRMMPRRAEELLGDDKASAGSIYWVIKGLVRCRQRLLGIEAVADEQGRATHLLLDPELVSVWPTAWRAFQGWRYLQPEQAPPDLESALGHVEGEVDEMPPEMLVELRQLGLL